MRSPDAPVQSLLFRAPVRARGRFGPGARGHPEHCAHLLAPVGVSMDTVLHAPQRWQVCGRWGGQQPGAETAEPEVVPPLAEGVPELQQADADTAPVIPAERLLPDLLPRVVRGDGGDEVIPRRAGMSLGGGSPYTRGAR